MNHEPEPPSWMSGAAAVGTGAGPPNEDQQADENHDGPAYRYDVGAADEDDAPRFSDEPQDTGFGELPADEPGYGSPGFGSVPPATPGFGAAQDTNAYGASDPPAAGFGAPSEPAPGFEPGPQGNFGGNYPGQYPGSYQPSGFVPPQGDGSYGGGPAGPYGGAPDGSYGGGPAGPYGRASDGPYGGAASDGPYGGAPAGGVAYGAAAAGAGYLVGQEHGAGFQGQAPPLPGQYRSPRKSRRAKVKTSLPSVKTSLPSPWRGRKARRAARAGRQAQLTVARVEPWSVMKFSFVISLVAFIVLFVAVAVLYAVLSGLGVFDALQRTVASITSSQSQSGFNLNTYLSASRVLGYTGLLGAINVVLITALSTVGAVLYNLTADLAGGIEVTLKETD